MCILCKREQVPLMMLYLLASRAACTALPLPVGPSSTIRGVCGAYVRGLLLMNVITEMSEHICLYVMHIVHCTPTNALPIACIFLRLTNDKNKNNYQTNYYLTVIQPNNRDFIAQYYLLE